MNPLRKNVRETLEKIGLADLGRKVDELVTAFNETHQEPSIVVEESEECVGEGRHCFTHDQARAFCEKKKQEESIVGEKVLGKLKANRCMGDTIYQEDLEQETPQAQEPKERCKNCEKLEKLLLLQTKLRNEDIEELLNLKETHSHPQNTNCSACPIKECCENCSWEEGLPEDERDKCYNTDCNCHCVVSGKNGVFRCECPCHEPVTKKEGLKELLRKWYVRGRLDGVMEAANAFFGIKKFSEDTDKLEEEMFKDLLDIK